MKRLSPLCIALAACSGEIAPITLPPEPEPIAITFAAKVNGEPFSCGSSYAGVGTTGSTITPTDLRFFVHRVRLVTSSGAEVPVTLDVDGKWQLSDVALLDFENGAGPCAGGTAATNDRVFGTVPPGVYTGLRFTLGVPFERNHINPVTAPAPLSSTAMAWSWNGGYLFLRAEMKTSGQPGGFAIHLGSTGCNGATASTPPTSCANPNRPEIALAAFDPIAHFVVFDLGQLLAGSNVDENTSGASGCQSSVNDAECAPVFARFGLTFNGAPSPGQTVFGVRGVP